VDLDVEVQVPHQPTHDRELLIVLLAEHREVGLRREEEPGDDRRDAAEVAGPVAATQLLGQALDLDPGAVPRRVDLLGRRGEDDVTAGAPELRDVALEVAGVAVEVLVRPELRRVHEDADDHSIGGDPRLPHEREVPLVKRPHRRHERDAPI
jgi:hypothetical protein